MRTYIIVIASALLLAALTVGLSSKLPGGNFTLLLIAFLALVVNGLFCARLAGPGAAGGSAQSKRARSRGANRPRKRPEAAARRSEDSPPEEGAIKWFDDTKGFGFIIRDAGGEIFVHKRSVKVANGGRPQLPDGQRVRFQVAENEKGPYATNVTAL